MTHDPLCPIMEPTRCHNDPTRHDRGVPGDCSCGLRCACDFIARVRSRERDRAAERVAALPQWIEDFYSTVDYEDAVDAARGDD